MNGERIDDDLRQDGQPEGQTCRRPARVTQAGAEDSGHLFAVFGAKRGGIEMEEGVIDAHYAFPGAKPLARASLSICASRRASAVATLRPNGVIL